MKCAIRYAALLPLLCALCLALCACSPQAETAPDCAGLAETLAASQTFAELTAIPQARAAVQLDIDEALLADAAMSLDASRATPEAIVVLTAVDEDALETLREALEAYRAALEEEYRDYRPDELPKVENALLRTRGLPGGARHCPRRRGGRRRAGRGLEITGTPPARKRPAVRPAAGRTP